MDLFLLLAKRNAKFCRRSTKRRHTADNGCPIPHPGNPLMDIHGCGIYSRIAQRQKGCILSCIQDLCHLLGSLSMAFFKPVFVFCHWHDKTDSCLIFNFRYCPPHNLIGHTFFFTFRRQNQNMTIPDYLNCL